MTIRNRALPACLALLALSGCITPKTPAQAVYQIQGDYTAALSVELAYDALPSCESETKPILCRKESVARLVRQIDDTAWEAISAAQKAVRTPGFGDDKLTTVVATATGAVGAFTGIVQTLGVK